MGQWGKKVQFKTHKNGVRSFSSILHPIQIYECNNIFYIVSNFLLSEKFV